MTAWSYPSLRGRNRYGNPLDCGRRRHQHRGGSFKRPTRTSELNPHKEILFGLIDGLSAVIDVVLDLLDGVAHGQAPGDKRADL